MYKTIYAKFYNEALKEISLEEIKDYGLKPICGGYWWLIPELIEGIVGLAGEGAAAAGGAAAEAAATGGAAAASTATPSLISSVTPYLSAGSTAASLMGSDNSKASPPTAPKFGQSPSVQTPDIYGQTPTSYQNNFSANMMGDYGASQPKYGPQGGANPWQEQIMSQLLQQQDIQRSKPAGGGGEKK